MRFLIFFAVVALMFGLIYGVIDFIREGDWMEALTVGAIATGLVLLIEACFAVVLLLFVWAME